MPSIPSWVLSHARPEFGRLARLCPICAWAVLLILIVWFILSLWYFARGYQLFQGVEKRPFEATGAKAGAGLAWMVALIVFLWLAGPKSLVPLLGDTIFVAFAALFCLERFVWWKFPPSIGKATELAVLAVYWWLAWLVALKIPAGAAWYALVMTAAASSVWFVYVKLTGAIRTILLRNVLPGIFLPCLFLPASLRPSIPTAILCLSIGLMFSWLGVIVGAFWLKLPEEISGFIAPIWFATSLVCQKLHVPGFVD